MITDLLVLGTGVTGRLALKYLLNHPERASFTLALGGRSLSKLQAIKEDLSLPDDVELVVVDVQVAEQVEAAVKKVRVVLNTVGPFWVYGPPVVAACVRHGVHHVDISAETHWVKYMISSFHDDAVKTGTIIVPAAGNQSLPSDIVTYLGHKTIQAVNPSQPAQISKSTTALELVVESLSGGSIATLAATFGVPGDVLATANASYALSPITGQPSIPKYVSKLLIPYTSNVLYGSASLTSAPNTSIVQRTWGLLEADPNATGYGPHFEYEEFQPAPSWTKAFVASCAQMALIAVLRLVISSPLKTLLPTPGEGPKDKDLKKGHLDVVNITSSLHGDLHAKTTFKAKGDGYYLTAVMASESALSLLGPTQSKGGVLTPATAFPNEIARRLNEFGDGVFEIESRLLEPQRDETKKSI